jgi:hypothetical protein
MGERPSNAHTIERVDNDRDYEPGNCVWATRSEQNRNRRNTRWITFQGRTQTLSEWSKELGLSRSALRERLVKHGTNGWQSRHANYQHFQQVMG